MGSKSQRRKAFLLQHPRCCFCGGIAPSEEEDHFPSKGLFENKQWPEGFVFPACVSCNRVTRHHEQIVAMLARLYPDPTTDVGRREVHERMRAVAHNFPGLLEDMRPTAEDSVLAQEKYGLKVPPGASPEDLPVLSLRSERLHSAWPNLVASLPSRSSTNTQEPFFLPADKSLSAGMQMHKSTWMRFRGNWRAFSISFRH